MRSRTFISFFYSREFFRLQNFSQLQASISYYEIPKFILNFLIPWECVTFRRLYILNIQWLHFSFQSYWVFFEMLKIIVFFSSLFSIPMTNLCSSIWPMTTRESNPNGICLLYRWFWSMVPKALEQVKFLWFKSLSGLYVSVQGCDGLRWSNTIKIYKNE